MSYSGNITIIISDLKHILMALVGTPRRRGSYEFPKSTFQQKLR